MNKTKAKNEVLENSRTFADYSKLVAGFKYSSKKSVVNKHIPKESVLSIYENYLAARKPEDKPVVEHYNPHRERMVLSVDALGLINILRDCA